MSRKSARTPLPKLQPAPAPPTLADIARKHPGDFKAQAAEIREAIQPLIQRRAQLGAQMDDVNAALNGLSGALEAIQAQIPPEA